MVAYYFLKKDFDPKDSKWIFEIHFKEEHFEERFLFKIGKWWFSKDNIQASNIGSQRKTKSQNRDLDNHVN